LAYARPFIPGTGLFTLVKVGSDAVPVFLK
jgi:hypothetical protein